MTFLMSTPMPLSFENLLTTGGCAREVFYFPVCKHVRFQLTDEGEHSITLCTREDSHGFSVHVPMMVQASWVVKHLSAI